MVEKLIFFSYTQNEHEPKSRSKVHDLTLATQLSVDRLPQLRAMTSSWKGELHAAVLITSSSELTHVIHTLSVWKKCGVLYKTRLHLVLPRYRDLTAGDDAAAIEAWHRELTSSSDPCSDLPVFNSSGKKCRFDYPYNVMRNVARRQVETSHLLVVDVDVLPSPDTRSEFLRALSSTEGAGRAAFVVPAFEIKRGHRIPQNKKALESLIRVGNVRVFHEKTCPVCHKYTR